MTFGGGTKAERLTVIAIRGARSPLRRDRQPAVGVAPGCRDDPLRDLLLEHQGQRSPPRRPVAAQPAQQQRGADIVGQVGDDMGAVADDLALVERKRIGLDRSCSRVAE